MKRIATANREVDKYGAGKDGFRAAVPGVSDPTYLSATFMNGVQESIVRTIEAAGLAPSDDPAQFSTAVLKPNQMADAVGASLVGWKNGTSPITVEMALNLLFMGVKNPCNPKYAGGAVGDGVHDDYAALTACLADPSSRFVSFPASLTLRTTSAVLVPSGTIILSCGGKIIGAGNNGLFTLAYPSVETLIDGLVLDGMKTSGTADVVTLIYAPGSTATPTVRSKRLTVRNCILRNGSAGMAFENASDCDVYGNFIEGMFRHTTGAYAGSYGYGVVLNGCTNSKVHSNTIGSADFPIERHGIYMPVFLDSQAAPTFTNFCADILIENNRISMRHDPANEPFSSCIEAWNYFDISILNNHLIGGMRGINATPEYTNGSRVRIIGNTFKDNEICIRNDRATKGAAPGTYYFEEYQIIGNNLIPLTTVAAHQAVFIQGVKNVIFNDNYAKGNASTSFAFGYYDVAFNNIVADLITSTGNIISGFAQGFYLANVTKFVDNTAFRSFTGAPLPYVRVAAIGSSEMTPRISPATSLYAYNGGDWAGVSYFETALGKTIRNNGSFWVDQKGIRVRGATLNRPNNVSIVAGSAAAAEGMFTGLDYGFQYYDEGAAAMLYWNGVTWFTAQQPAPPLGATTADLNAFKVAYPNALSYGAISWNTTTSKPVFFNANTSNWVYSDGTAI